ncbi:MAG: FAD-binding oxidoreductase [Blastocatellia bacterium]|nr:FAD-binding oxidoreductase [Blastocatellia bacterium]
MIQTADVVIIGGGIIGCSVAYHLTKMGCKDVVILERETFQGKHSTGRSAGGVRQQFATPVNIRMSKYSIQVLHEFHETMGQDPEYHPYGYLFIATTDEHIRYLQENMKAQLAEGIPVRFLSRGDVEDMVPQLYTEDVLGGSFCPTDGFVDPYSVMQGYNSRARAQGAKVLLETEVTNILTQSGRISGVVTSHGTISTRTVVNASGAWARIVGSWVGVDVPIRPTRRQLVNTEKFDELPTNLPMLIDMATGCYMRKESGGVMIGWADPDEPESFSTVFNPDFIDVIIEKALPRMPCLENAGINLRRCWGGLYDISPDHHAIIGPVPNLEGFILCNGFSGHGIMHSPAMGVSVAEMILYGESRTLDVHELTVERFAKGELLHETAVI